MRGALLVLVVCRAVADADGVADEVSAGTTVGSSASSWIANRISGVWDVDDHLTLQLDYSVTRSSSYAQTGALSLAYVAGDHWSLGVTGAWAPASTSTSPTTLELEDDVAFADAELSATSSSISVAVSATYDTAGESDHETTASLSLGVDHLQSQQTLGSIVADDGALLTTADLRDYCRERMCSPEVSAALSPLWSQLSRFAINGSLSRTELGDTDLGVDVTYYLYDKDPLSAGYFRLPGVGPSQLGNGIAIAPLRYAVSPTVANRWGKLQGTVGLAYGSYLAAQGFELGANVKVNYKVKLGDGMAVRVFSTLASSWNVDAVNALTTSLSLSLGGKYTW